MVVCGVILAFLSLIYSVNIYFEWFPTTHSQALFGFVFYLWLGVYLNKYYDSVIALIKRLPWWLMISIVVTTFLIAVKESFFLLDLGSKDAYNTLRISNIIYSLVMFAALLKLGKVSFLQNRLQPRQTTFGVYLLHYLIIERGLVLIFRPLKLDFSQFTVWQNSGILFVRFVITYIVCIIITKLILKTRFKWTVGQS